MTDLGKTNDTDKQEHTHTHTHNTTRTKEEIHGNRKLKQTHKDNHRKKDKPKNVNTQLEDKQHLTEAANKTNIAIVLPRCLSNLSWLLCTVFVPICIVCISLPCLRLCYLSHSPLYLSFSMSSSSSFPVQTAETTIAATSTLASDPFFTQNGGPQW